MHKRALSRLVTRPKLLKMNEYAKTCTYEYCLDMAEVTGSNPVSPTKKTILNNNLNQFLAPLFTPLKTNRPPCDQYVTG